MIYEKLRIKDISRKLKNSEAIISAYIPENSEELNYTKKLSLVMNNYRASGAGGYECYDKCKVVKEIVLEMPEIIINYFKNNPNVTVDTTKYITVKY